MVGIESEEAGGSDREGGGTRAFMDYLPGCGPETGDKGKFEGK